MSSSNSPAGKPSGKGELYGQQEASVALELRLAKVEGLLLQLVGQQSTNVAATNTMQVLQGVPLPSPLPPTYPDGTLRACTNEYGVVSSEQVQANIDSLGVDVTNAVSQVLGGFAVGEARSNESERINAALAQFQQSVASYVPSSSTESGVGRGVQGELQLTERDELNRLRELFEGLNMQEQGNVGVPSSSGESPGAYGSSHGFAAAAGASMFPVVRGSSQQGSFGFGSGVHVPRPALPRARSPPMFGSPLGEALGSGPGPSLQPREVKLDRPLTFNGKKKDLQNFLFVMKQYIDSVGLGEGQKACRFLVSYLRDDALTWWRSFSRDSLHVFDSLDLETLIDELSAHFCDIDREMKLRDRLFTLRQVGNVGQYVTQFKQLQLELGQARVADDVALHLLLNGLKPFTQQSVLMQRPETFEDAVVLAERADAVVAWRQRSSTQQPRRTFYKPSDGGRGQAQYSDSRYKGPAPMVLGAMDVAQGKPVCYHCGKPGHIKKDCFKLKNSRGQDGSKGAGKFPPAPSKN